MKEGARWYGPYVNDGGGWRRATSDEILRRWGEREAERIIRRIFRPSVSLLWRFQ